MTSLGVVVGTAVLLVLAASPRGCAADPFQRPLSNERLAVHVLNRLAYGPGPGDLETMHRLGVDAWIRQQLHPTRIPDGDSGASGPSVDGVALPALASPVPAGFGMWGPPRMVPDFVEGKIRRALRSPRQLEEVLVDFWFNHFNVFSGKQRVPQSIASYERAAIRPHVLGRFEDMLLATAQHPAMLVYLDNHVSNGAAGLNENYGRELLELHTLGVDGGYTQSDVVNVARAFTGWTVLHAYPHADYYFNPAMHDYGFKTVLGRRIARTGELEGRTVISILARHPSTARLISRKLAQRFVADDPPPALVDRMAATFRETDGDLRAVTKTLLRSREFRSEGAWQAKLKSPFELVMSALRALDAEVTDVAPLARRLADMGQPLYGKAEPTGYSNTGEVWASAAGLLGRMTFASALAAGAIDGTTLDARAIVSPGVRRAMTRITGIAPSAETVTVLGGDGHEQTPPEVLLAVLLASPDFQRR